MTVKLMLTCDLSLYWKGLLRKFLSGKKLPKLNSIQGPLILVSALSND